ncbi:MAG: phosphonate metabolism protein/1,5-bisphosphokinase (PRPP-forming) PhnN [Rhodobacteraceae bacterium]|nr:phosphonate metabolism protein/1,5-bisphosphokinase (PRPP-forming) PhnN [Paracoccaceae bacterium]
MTGRLIGVVGPSGVGKDSVIEGLAAALPQLVVAKRVITRAPELEGEDFAPVTVDMFHRQRAAGAFCLSWGAHGLFYGIPKDVLEQVRTGREVLVNLSRGVLSEADHLFPAFVALNVTARPEILAQRLRARGRETPEDIAARLSRQGADLPADVTVLHLSNDGALEDTIARATALLSKIEA